MLLFLGLETLRIFYGETDPSCVGATGLSPLPVWPFAATMWTNSCWRFIQQWTLFARVVWQKWRPPCSVRLFRLEGEPVRAFSGLLHVALHPDSLCGAGRLRPAAADLRPAARVRPQRRPALLLRPRAPARTLLLIGLLQVAESWQSDGGISDNYSSKPGNVKVHVLFFKCFLVGPRCTEEETSGLHLKQSSNTGQQSKDLFSCK